MRWTVTITAGLAIALLGCSAPDAGSGNLAGGPEPDASQPDARPDARAAIDSGVAAPRDMAPINSLPDGEFGAGPDEGLGAGPDGTLGGPPSGRDHGVNGVDQGVDGKGGGGRGGGGECADGFGGEATLTNGEGLAGAAWLP